MPLNKYVPIEPTNEMICAALNEVSELFTDELVRAYKAMVAAAPEQPTIDIEATKQMVRNAVLESAAEVIEREGEGWGEDSKYRPHYSDMAAIIRLMKYQEAP